MSVANIAVIGSGVAATTTLIELFNKLIEGVSAHEKLNITVIEKHHEFFKGTPYGSRSSLNSLTITGTNDFVSDEKEKKLFNTWLQNNHDEWTRYYRLNGGQAAQVWLEKNLPLIKKGQWVDIYLPRFIFGWYMQGKMLSLIKIVEEKQLAKVTLIQGEAIDVKLDGKGLYDVTIEATGKKLSVIKTQKLVIATGAAPVKNNAGEIKTDSSYVYINELYEPSLDENLEKLNDTLAQTSEAEERNVLVIGSNASCIELLYLLDHRPDILSNINKIAIISRAGILPHYISEDALDDYPTKNLDALKNAGNYNVHNLIDATKKDMAAAIQHTVIVPHINRIIGYTIELLHTLNDEKAKKIFFSIYGPQLTKLIRRSGPAYKESADNLIAKNKLKLIKGNFLNIERNASGGIMNYAELTGNKHTYPVSFKVIINCSGSNSLQTTSSRLLRRLLDQKICGLTLSGEGLAVNEQFEAAPNLYIIGPLVAGNVNNIIHFWHLESVSRLLYLAPYLAAELIG